MASASPLLAEETVCQPERVTTDRARLTARVSLSEIQEDLQGVLSNTSKVLRKLDPVSISTTSGAIRVSGTLALSAGRLFSRSASGPAELYSFNITFRPSVENKCGQTYLTLEFLRVSLEQNDLMKLFPLVENLVDAVLDDESVKSYVATFLSKPFGLAPEGTAELLDRKNVDVDGDKKTIKFRVDFAALAAELARSTRVSVGAKRVAANPALLRELSQLRLWGFGPEITRSSGDSGSGYEPQFLIELGRGIPDANLRASMDKQQAEDREFVRQALAADLRRYGDVNAMLATRNQLVSAAKTKLVGGRGAPVGTLELRQIGKLEMELEGEILAGLRADNPLFYGDPEAQARDLKTAMAAKVESLFDELTRNRQMMAMVETEASQLREGDRPFVEQRTSEQTLQQFLHFGDGATYKGEPVFRDLELRLLPVMDEVALRGLLHMNIPAWTAGFLDSKVSKGVSGFAGNYLPFRVIGKLVFTPQGELLFNLQSLSLDLPGSKEPFVIRASNKAGYFLFDAVEQLLATTVVPSAMAGKPNQQLVLDTLKATKPTKRGDMIVLTLDVPSSPLYKFIPEHVRDLRFWRVGSHDSQSVGRKFFELAAGGGPVSRTYWREQQARQAEAVARLQAREAGRPARPPKDIGVDMQLRFQLPELKRRIDLMLQGVKKVGENQLARIKEKDAFGVAVVTSALTVDFPTAAQLDQVAEKLLVAARKRDRNAQKETLVDILKLSMKATAHAVHAPKVLRWATGDDYTFDFEAELHLKLALIPTEQFTGDFQRAPLFLGQQVFELELVHGWGKVTRGMLAKIAGWGANHIFDLDDADFENPKSEKLKVQLLKFILPQLDNDKGNYLVKQSGEGATAKFFHLNTFLRFFSTDKRFAFQLNPRLFSPSIDLQIAHPVPPKLGEQELLFDGKKIGLRFETDPKVNQLALDCAMRPSLAGIDELTFAAIVKDATALLTPLGAARTASEFMSALKQANLRETFLKPIGESEYETRSIVARLNRLTRIYPYLSRHGNTELLEAPEGLGTGLETVAYARTLIEIRRAETAAIETARRLGLTQQLAADPDFRPFTERYGGKKGDGSDSVQKERIEPLLTAYRDKFLQRNQAVIASSPESDWTRSFRADAEKAQRIYNEISR